MLILIPCTALCDCGSGITSPKVTRNVNTNSLCTLTAPEIDRVRSNRFNGCMKIISNPYRGTSIASQTLADIPFPSVNADAPTALLARCPASFVTPLIDARDLAADLGIAALAVKDERTRMGLGSFKALGAAYVIAHLADQAGGPRETALKGQTFITASAGNHGLSVAAGATVFGARSVVYLSETVPENFAARLAGKGADVRRAGADYEASMQAALDAADANGWTLLSDSSWPGYTVLPHRLMEGYLALADEAERQILQPPTHVFLQAGVGGLAGAVAALARARWGDAPQIIVVEPDFAPALAASITAGEPVVAQGPVSSMGRLDCKEPSLIALRGLSRDADYFMTITEDEAEAAMPVLSQHGLATTPSGGAGLAGLIAAVAEGHPGLNSEARVLTILSEEPQP